jgi:hypothetical protein
LVFAWQRHGNLLEVKTISGNHYQYRYKSFRFAIYCNRSLRMRIYAIISETFLHLLIQKLTKPQQTKSVTIWRQRQRGMWMMRSRPSSLPLVSILSRPYYKISCRTYATEFHKVEEGANEVSSCLQSKVRRRLHP